jgi:hypothetical protein
MVDLSPHDVLAGGALGYMDHLSTLGVHLQHIEVFDDDAHPLRVNGIAVSPAGEIFLAAGDPEGTRDNDPHDVAYVATVPPKLATLVARSDNTMELWTLALDLTLIEKFTGLATDSGWTRDRYGKLRVGTDHDTLYYTDRGRTIFRWSLEDGVQLPHHVQLPLDSPYVYAGFDLDDAGDIVIAVTEDGNGPRNAVALDGLAVWTDEVEPDDAIYHVLKLSALDFSDILTYPVSLSPAGANAEITALAVSVVSGVVARRRVQSALIA